MNEKVYKFFLTGDKLRSEMQSKQPNFTNSACGLFTRSKERLQKFMQQGDTNYIYKNDLDKAFF